jgi:hypothetical protein
LCDSTRKVSQFNIIHLQFPTTVKRLLKLVHQWGNRISDHDL